MENSVPSFRITSLYGSQPSCVVLDAKQRILDWNKKYLSPSCNLSFCACKPAWFAPEWQVHLGSIPHLWFFSCKSATLRPDLQVCIGPWPHLWFSAHIAACLTQEWKDYIGSSHHVWFCACKSATLANEFLVSTGPSPHLWLLDAKQRLFDQNNKSLWVQDLTWRFVHAKQRD